MTNAYRLAYANVCAGKPFDPLHRKEVESVSHREYGTGFYYGAPSENADVCKTNEYIKDRAFLCVITGYDANTKLARCIQRNKLRRGDKAQLLTPGAVGRDIATDELFDETARPLKQHRTRDRCFTCAVRAQRRMTSYDRHETTRTDAA